MASPKADAPVVEVEAKEVEKVIEVKEALEEKKEPTFAIDDDESDEDWI